MNIYPSYKVNERLGINAVRTVGVFDTYRDAYEFGLRYFNECELYEGRSPAIGVIKAGALNWRWL